MTNKMRENKRNVNRKFDIIIGNWNKYTLLQKYMKGSLSSWKHLFEARLQMDSLSIKVLFKVSKIQSKWTPHSQTQIPTHRDIIKECVNASDEDAVIFTGSGSTGAINKLVNAMEIKAKKAKDTVVIVGPFEHHSNILPWKETGAEVRWDEDWRF